MAEAHLEVDSKRSRCLAFWLPRPFSTRGGMGGQIPTLKGFTLNMPNCRCQPATHVLLDTRSTGADFIHNGGVASSVASGVYGSSTIAVKILPAHARAPVGVVPQGVVHAGLRSRTRGTNNPAMVVSHCRYRRGDSHLLLLLLSLVVVVVVGGRCGRGGRW